MGRDGGDCKEILLVSDLTIYYKLYILTKNMGDFAMFREEVLHDKEYDRLWQMRDYGRQP